MIVIGVTGSIGMGKSVTARLFVEEGDGALQSADDVVHALYGPGGAAALALVRCLPEILSRDGSVDRARLRERIQARPALLRRVEAVVHPLVRQERERFLARAEEADASFAVLEIPLLFETGMEREVDTVVVASAPEEVQAERVLSRPGMTEPAFHELLSRQVPDSVKRSRADHVIETGRGIEFARAQVRLVLDRLGLSRGESRNRTGGSGCAR